MYTQIEEEMARLRAEGRRTGRREVLERLVAKKFGADAAGQLSGRDRRPGRTRPAGRGGRRHRVRHGRGVAGPSGDLGPTSSPLGTRLGV